MFKDVDGSTRDASQVINDAESARLLLQAGAHLEALDDTGRTPLALAAAYGNLDAQPENPCEVIESPGPRNYMKLCSWWVCGHSHGSNMNYGYLWVTMVQGMDWNSMEEVHAFNIFDIIHTRFGPHWAYEVLSGYTRAGAAICARLGAIARCSQCRGKKLWHHGVQFSPRPSSVVQELQTVLAFRCGAEDALRVYVEFGANLEARDNGKLTALLWAAVNGNEGGEELALGTAKNAHWSGQLSSHRSMSWALGMGTLVCAFRLSCLDGLKCCNALCRRGAIPRGQRCQHPSKR